MTVLDAAAPVVVVVMVVVGVVVPDRLGSLWQRPMAVRTDGGVRVGAAAVAMRGRGHRASRVAAIRSSAARATPGIA